MNISNILDDPDFNILKRQFLNFLEKESFYSDSIDKLIDQRKNRLIINLNDIRAFDISIAKRLLSSPIKVIPPIEAALNELVNSKTTDKKAKELKIFCVGFEGSFGDHLTTPMELGSSYLTQLVCIEGIVTKISLVRPKRKETVHFCDATKKFSSVLYRDGTDFENTPTGSAVPVKDIEGNLLQLEFGYSKYIDSQKMCVQDMPERSAAGQMPRSAEIVLEGDLVDSCKAGDRVQVIGVYRAMAWKASGTTNSMFKTLLITNNVRVISQISKSTAMTEKDIENIKKVSKRKDALELFSRSIAPNLFGHEIVKRAIVLLLLGGVEKILENKTHIRGDINMLLLGDPSVGKSQLLRAIMQIAKLSVSTTGKGSTGVGLTAAVLKDRDTGERYLEAGATVLADRGIICIDEFDKMSEIDRTAIHEVMEQQTVTIAKAGVHTSLNARCSVVAAANPVYSNYDQSKSPQQNIPLPDSILSRFDVLFLVLDKLDSQMDRDVSGHVLRMHRYNKGDGSRDIFDCANEEDGIEEETAIYQKFDRLLHNRQYIEVPSGSKKKKAKKRNQFLTLDFMRKYIEFAKKTYKPILTKKAVKKICNAYCLIRNSDETMNLPITARYVETIIRFSTAHAKLRLSEKIEEIDVETVLEILYYSLNNEKISKEGEENEEEDKENIEDRQREIGKKRKGIRVASSNEKEGISQEVEAEISSGSNTVTSAEKKKSVMKVISSLTRGADSEVSCEEVLKNYNEDASKKGEISRKELNVILADLESLNRVMVVKGIIHRI